MSFGRVSFGLFAKLAFVAAVFMAPAHASLAAQQEAPPGAQGELEDPFPHGDHEGLFPLCTGCHEGAGSATATTLYPEPSGCVGCHDGSELDRVSWERPTPLVSHLEYDHTVHRSSVEQAGDAPQDCTSCHAPSVEERWAVVSVRADGCWTCHETTDHLMEGECTTCHTPLSASTLVDSTVAAWQAPADHELEGFLESRHGELDLTSADANRCATCHTQDQCASCHVDATLEAVQALNPAPPALASLQIEARYPVPRDHETTAWLEAHGDGLQSSDCSTCHTRDDCRSCHVGSASTVTAPLVSRANTRAPGVGLTRTPPSTHEAPSFANAHGEVAALSETRCTTCHVQTECMQCHLADGLPSAAGPMQMAGPMVPAGRDVAQSSVRHGELSQATVAPQQAASMLHQSLEAPPAATGGFHPSNFVMSHSTDSWNGLLECSNCHETQLFCRSCHVESGLGSSGRLGQGYHDAQPLWLLRHGQSARQALESCASCHRQNECLQCHSTTGAFRVSPHSSDFDPQAVQEKAGRTCYACHLGGPPGGSER